MKEPQRNSEAMPHVELPLLEYALLVRGVRESSFNDAIVAIQKWSRIKCSIYAALGMSVGLILGLVLSQ